MPREYNDTDLVEAGALREILKGLPTGGSFQIFDLDQDEVDESGTPTVDGTEGAIYIYKNSGWKDFSSELFNSLRGNTLRSGDTYNKDYVWIWSNGVMTTSTDPSKSRDDSDKPLSYFGLAIGDQIKIKTGTFTSSVPYLPRIYFENHSQSGVSLMVGTENPAINGENLPWIELAQNSTIEFTIPESTLSISTPIRNGIGLPSCTAEINIYKKDLDGDQDIWLYHNNQWLLLSSNIATPEETLDYIGL